MNFKIAMVTDMTGVPEQTEILSQQGVEFVKRDCETEADVIAAARDADYLLTVGHMRPIGRRVIEKLEKCRFIQTTGIGYDGIDVAAATEYGIGVVNIPDYCIEEASDHTMALILACSRRIAHLDKLVREGNIPVSDIDRKNMLEKVWYRMDHLRGKTLGLVGFGRIARATVPKAKGFGMEILTHSPSVPQSFADELAVQMVDLTRLLKTSDFVSLHGIQTPEKRHMIGLQQLKNMKPSACLINTARGTLVDHQALYEALTKGYIAAAGLDATDPEPIPPESPLLELDNVVFTAHSAHASASTRAELRNRPFEDAAKVWRGQWPLGLVNPEVKEKDNCRGPCLSSKQMGG